MEHKTKKIMCWERIKHEICVEVNAMDEEGTEVIIRQLSGSITRSFIHNMWRIYF